ncbi:ABC transporter substrate-binding protein [Streptomyces acidicola]|uniref:ABC transporter substrate-binding protein n=1 Tax=Streptomyces acidicola TaxID=2596892 RepID=UPI00342CB041
MRRKTLSIPIVLGLTVAATASCSVASGGSASGTSLTFVSYGSAFQDNQRKAWQEPYTKQTGVTFRNDGPSDPAKLKAMVEAGSPSWDVVGLGANHTSLYCGTYLQKLDLSQIDTSKYPKGTVGPCGVPAYIYGLHFMYNTKAYKKNVPTTIADFFDTKKFPGKRILPPEVSIGIMEDALLADGVPADKLYPLDVDRALRKLTSIKKDSTFATTYGQMQQAMVDDQADMALVVTARAYSSLKAGATFAPVWDKTILTWDDLVIPKGIKNKDQAMKFIAFTAKAAQSAKFTELANVVPANGDAKPTLNAQQSGLNPMSPEHKAGTVISDMDWWSKNYDAVQKKYTAWLTG